MAYKLKYISFKNTLEINVLSLIHAGLKLKLWVWKISYLVKIKTKQKQKPCYYMCYGLDVRYAPKVQMWDNARRFRGEIIRLWQPWPNQCVNPLMELTEWWLQECSVWLEEVGLQGVPLGYIFYSWWVECLSVCLSLSFLVLCSQKLSSATLFLHDVLPFLGPWGMKMSIYGLRLLKCEPPNTLFLL